jgi:hypothetical protein
MSTPKPHTVHVRLMGSVEDVAFWLDLLDDLAVIEYVSEPQAARHNQIRVYAVVTRRAPLKGYAQ